MRKYGYAIFYAALVVLNLFFFGTEDTGFRWISLAAAILIAAIGAWMLWLDSKSERNVRIRRESALQYDSELDDIQEHVADTLERGCEVDFADQLRLLNASSERHFERLEAQDLRLFPWQKR